MNQNVFERPLTVLASDDKIGVGEYAHKRDPDIATPVRPMKMTGFRPILLFCSARSTDSGRTHSDNLAQWYTVKN